MKNLLIVYRIMFQHWGLIIGGVITMAIYAMLGGVSITVMIPLFDFVFTKNKGQILYSNLDSFFGAIQTVLANFVQANGSLISFKSISTYTPLWNNIKTVLYHTDSSFLLAFICGLVVILILGKNTFFYLQRVFFINLRGKTVLKLRNYVYQKYLFQSMVFYNENKVGDSLVRMVSDVEMVNNEFIGNLFNVLRDLISLFVYMRICIFLNYKLFLFSMLVLPIFTLSVDYLGKKIKKYSKRIQEQFSNMFSNVEEVLSSMRVVKAFVREDYELERFNKINNRYFRFWRKSQLYSSLSQPITEINSVLTGVVVLVLGGKEMLAPGSTFSLGDFTAFLFAMFSMMQPAKAISQAYADIRKALVSLDRISEIINRESEIKNVENPVFKKTFEKNIEFKNVSFSYVNDKAVLKNVSFVINKGERIAMVGSSGSGKTTLGNLLPRMYDFQEGEIFIDGISIKDIDVKCLRQLFGIVTQESILFSDTVAGNIQYGSREQLSFEEIQKACQIAYADEFIENLPEKYDTYLQTRASILSGGQRQRLCIARAIVSDPPILLFDEATSALDTDSEKKVQDAIDRATKDRTVIIIAHRLSTILKCDKILVMDDGFVLDIGRHEELILRCDRYKQLYNLQFGEFERSK